ncbi:MAG: ATP-binding protein [Cytophagaceae bacterium]
MNKFFNVRIALLISLTLLILLWIGRTYVLHLDQWVFTKQLQIKVDNRIDKAQDLNNQIASLFDSKKNYSFSFFNSIAQTSYFPFYVYKNKQLVYWSRQDIIPDISFLEPIDSIGTINIEEGKFIVNHKRVGEYDIYSLIILEREFPVENRYLKGKVMDYLFHSVPVVLKQTSYSEYDYPISSKYPIMYFSFVELEQSYLLDDVITLLYLIVVFTSIVLWYRCVFLSKYPKLFLFIKLLGYVLIRAIIYWIPATQLGSESFLFSPQYFASSNLTSSLFDVLLTLALIGFVTREVFSSKAYKKILFIPIFHQYIWLKRTVNYLILVSLFILFNIYYQVLNTLVLNSSNSLDFINHLTWTLPGVLSILLVVILSWVFFLLIHPLYTLLGKNIEKESSVFVRYFLPMLLVVSIYCSMVNHEQRIVGIVFASYTWIIVALKFPAWLQQMRYQSFLYLFSFSIASSLLISTSLFFKGTNRLNQQKKRFAENILYERDEITEFLLYDVSKGIRKDAFIREKLSMPLSDYSLIENKVNKYYITNYFVDYSIRILIFNASGHIVNLGKSNKDISTYLDEVVYSSDYLRERDIFIFNDKLTGIRKYISFNKIKNDNRIVGYVAVELTSNAYNKNRIFPELATDSRYIKEQEGVFDYAIIRNGNVESTYGLYNYNERFVKEFKSKSILYTTDFRFDNYHHYVTKNDETSWLIVSSPYAMHELIITQASVYFTLHILMILIFILYYIFRLQLRNINIGFATKIQLYVNLAYFIPLVVVSIITLGFVNSNNETEIEDTFLNVSEKLASLLSIQASQEGHLDDEKMAGILENSDLIKIQGYDINIFSLQGKLLATNHPEVFKRSVLTDKLNPLALQALIERNNQYIVLNEKIGLLQYKSVYRLIRSTNQAKPIGIIHMPFFESKVAVNKQVSQYLKIIINIFAISFLLLLIISYIVSVYLTYPLKLITQGIRKTGLEDNEPILWESSDEIGRLVQEYNSMLLKLEESKVQLSISEKESAWREMARQVAHEIKNPLTPMKLKIQYLLQRIRMGNDVPKEELQESFKTIISQVDTLSEIAGSFSSFYKLPELKKESLDWLQVVENIMDLHENHESIFTLTKEAEDYFVLADAKMLNNIVNNLVLNSLQSIPVNRSPKIELVFTKQESFVCLEVKDNGSGIPAEIKDRIFRPYFSTKYTGSGIGLALAKRLIEDMGGEIWFTTQEGIGTSFFIKLPQSQSVE